MIINKPVSHMTMNQGTKFYTLKRKPYCEEKIWFLKGI